MIGLFGHLTGRLGIGRKRAAQVVAPLSADRIAQIDAEIDASLAARRAAMPTMSDASRRGWEKKRPDRSRDPILPHRDVLLRRRG
jgi:hypothetical protein